MGFLCSCERNPEPLTENSILVGYAGHSSSNRDDSITVVAKGPYGTKSLTTDINGFYKFTGLGNGTYTLSFMRDGFGTIKQYGIQLFGGDSVRAYNVRLFRLITGYTVPDFVKISFGPIPRSNSSEHLILSTHQKLGYFPLLFFMSKNRNVNNVVFNYIEGNYWVMGPFEKPNYDAIYIELRNLPFKSGEEVFIIGYVCNLDEFRVGYVDTYLGIDIFSTLKADQHTPVMSFIMP